MIRKARIQDIQSIYKLLTMFGNKGELLSRPLSQLYDHIRDFTVYEDSVQQQIIGCCALQFCWEDLAEIRSLAVHESHWGKQVGSKLVEAVLQEARDYDIRNVFTLTYRPDFFKQYGFKVIDRGELPLKIWADCMHCVKFPDCDEVALMKEMPAPPPFRNRSYSPLKENTSKHPA